MADGLPTEILTAPPPRQTLGYIRNRLLGHGISPKSKLGQNFLIDLNLLDVIVTAAELSPRDLVLEVGSGTGSLTTRLAAVAGAVLGVEVDYALLPLLKEVLADKPNVRILHADALRTKNELNPLIASALAALRDAFDLTQWKLVANLPYAVATPVIANVLLGDDLPERMVVTVQWEIAERLTAIPGSSNYGALSVLVQSLSEVTVVRKLAPTVFWPRPKVDSAIVLVRPSPAKRSSVGDPVAFRSFLRDLYVHKRKSLRAGLIGWPSGRRDKLEVDALLQRLSIPGTARAEDLSLEDHHRLFREVRATPWPS